VNTAALHLILQNGFIEGAVVSSGRVLRASRAESGVPRLDELWGTDLAALDQPVAQIVRTLGVAPGTPTVVVYTSPKTIVEVFSVPARGAEALKAGSLALAEMLGVTADYSASTVMSIWESRSRTEPRSMVLAAGEPDTTPETICSLLERAGLLPRRLVPMRAASILSSWESSKRSGAQSAILVDIGSDHTTMLGVVAGELRLVRQVAIGYDLCVDAYERAIRATRTESEPPPARSEAARAFWTHGVPGRATSVDGRRTMGADVLPILQPIMQRTSIEIKQTLRFGLETDDRVAVRLVGPAASVPSLAGVLSDNADCAIETLRPDAQSSPPTEPGSLVQTLSAGLECRINLLPRALRERTAQKVFRRMALVGAGVAVIAVALEMGVVGRSAAEARADLEAARPEAAVLRRQVETRSDVARLTDALVQTEARVASLVGERVDWHGVLAMIAQTTGDDVRLSDIACAYDGSRPAVTLRGFADATTPTVDSLRAFVDRLAENALVDGVTLGATRLQDVDGEAVRSFSVVVHLTGSAPMTQASGGPK